MPQVSKSSWLPVLLPFAIRLPLAALTGTFWVPDEYYQALEPAHQSVFGYGHLTWEWTTLRPIRSFFYPSLFIPLYKLLAVLNLDDTGALVSMAAKGKVS